MSAVMNPPLAAVGLPPAAPKGHPPRPVRWSREEFMAIASLPELQDRRLQLLRGVIWDFGPMNTPHAAAIRKCQHYLGAILPPNITFSVQMPLDLSADTMPEPDLVVVPFRADFYASAHPTAGDASLVIEVADSSLQFDLTEKAELYAVAGISEYWVFDLYARVLHVLRDPGPLAANGTAYRSQQRLGPDDSVSPIAAPDLVVKVADLLP